MRDFSSPHLTPRIVLAAFGYLLLALLSPRVLNAQYQFETWDIDRGLPQNSIHSILQTRDGYLWLTTSDGLARFDGVRFTVFNIENTKGISSNRFERLYEDRAGSLWVTTGEAWVIRYRDGSFTTYSTGATRDDVATGIWGDVNGEPVISTRKGLAKLQGESFVAMPSPETKPCTAAFLSAGDLSWCRDNAGLHVLRRDGNTALYPLEGRLSGAGITYVYQDRAGNLWVATRSAGLNRLNDGVFTHFGPEASFNVMLESRDGALWFGTEGAGLVRFDGDRFTTYTTADGLSDNTIKSLYEDREGTLWAGTVNHGLVHLTRQLITTMAERQSLSPVNTYSVLEDHAGAIWIATWNDGLSRYENGKFTHLGKDNRIIPLRWVTALAEDRQGRLWIGAYAGIVGWYKDGKYTEVPYLPGQPTAVSVLLVDHNDALWIGTDIGLRKYQNGITTPFDTTEGLAGNNVKALHEDRQGNLWIGTYGGLSRFVNGKFETYRKEDGLASNRVRSIYEDQDGVIWVGTYDGGLSRLKDGKIVSYGVKDGLFDGGVFQILEDAHSNFWMSCNRGIYRVSKQELNDFADHKTGVIHSIAYGKRDGMLNVECNGGAQPAGIRARDGRLWFPTQEGVAIINPDEIQSNPEPPAVIIESGLLDQGPVDVRRAVRIEPGQQSLEIYYTGLSFIKPEQVTFNYKMEGLDKDWVNAGSRRVAYYPHLPPGHYTFMVRAANADGIWNTNAQRLEITVIPPFWRRWWFLAMAVFATAAAAFLIYERRISQLHRARAAQEGFSRQLIESQESERKRIAAELHDSIGQSLLVIKNRALVGLMKSAGDGGSQEEFDEIKASASQAINEVREIAYNLRPYLLDRVGLSKTLEAMIETNAAASGMSIGSRIAPIDGLLSKEGEINLYRIVQEGVNNIVKHAQAAEAMIEVTTNQNAIEIRIFDNGLGFDPRSAYGPKGRGFGLTGISERVRMLGGSYQITSTPGQGTTLTIKLKPLAGGKAGHDEA